MSVILRGKKYHYRFYIAGKTYSGAIPDLHKIYTKKDAEKYEAQKRAEILAEIERLKTEESAIRQNKSVVALVENYRRELSGGAEIKLSEVADLVRQKPWPKTASDKRWSQKITYWEDFVSFLAHHYPDIVAIDSIRKSHCEAYAAHLSTKGRFNKEIVPSGKKAYTSSYRLSSRTIRVVAGTCKSFIEKLAEDAGIFRNPWKGVILPELDPVSREIFSTAELRKIADGISLNPARMGAVYAGPMLDYDIWQQHAQFCRPLFLVAGATGLTEGDICTLRWDEIDWSTNFIHRRRRKTGNRLDIPLLPKLRSMLQKLPRTGDFIFPEYENMYIANPCGVPYRVISFLTGLGIKTSMDFDGRRSVSVKDLHSMRHVFCYYAKKAGIPTTIIARIVGHKTLAMTEHYANHSTQDDLTMAVRAMPVLLFGDGDIEDDAERNELEDIVRRLPIDKVRSLLGELRAASA